MNAFPTSEIDQLNGRGGMSARLLIASLVLPQVVAQLGTAKPTDAATTALAHADALIAAEGGS
ncbi:hypothetical protein [Niveibacterium terrae]|uniref:hypothetical protein n=1 Tax=Niveibacterium terrae TaxID=3373598 RepID=UPI003A902139